jgi:hypothetical protein
MMVRRRGWYDRSMLWRAFEDDESDDCADCGYDLGAHNFGEGRQYRPQRQLLFAGLSGLRK